MSKVVPGPVDWNTYEDILGLEQFKWRKRTIACCEFISVEDKSVLDIGAGNMYLKNILPNGITYYPLDYVKRAENTIVCDLNKYEFPDVNVDVAVCAGIIEYLNDLEWLFDKLSIYTRKIIVTYKSKEKGFENSLFTTDEIIRMLNKKGFILTKWNKELSEEWPLLACFEKATTKLLTGNYFCTGCGACKNKCINNAISLKPNEQGFLKPVIDFDKCVDCGECLNVCPEWHEVRNSNRIEQDCECYAVWADDEIREKSSSGGIFSVISDEIFHRKGIVYGVEYTEGFYVHHKSADNMEDLNSLRKSKYVQSNTENTFSEVYTKLEEGELVAYVGTPCQIAGLKAFIGKDYNNLLTVDVICFCVTPVSAFRTYLEENYGINQISNVVFRDKYKGWNADGYTIHKKDGSIEYLDMSTDDYQKAFHNVLCRNHVCDACRYAGFPRQADITMGDFWGITCHDESWFDGKGTSVAIINSEKGADFWNSILKKFKRIEKVPMEWCRGKGNRIADDGRARHNNADCFMEMIPKYGFKKSLDTALDKKHDIAMICMHNYNYGNNLTNYALYQYLSDMKLTVAVINYSGDCVWTEKRTDMAMFAHNPYAKCDLIPDFANRLDKKQVNAWCNSFVVASDQLFRAEFMREMNYHSSLDWVSSDKYKFSYATSFGTDEFCASEEEKEKVKFYLSRFNALSVREKSGLDILKNKFDLKAEWVLDPVFLCDRKYYQDMAKAGKLRLPESAYIGGYILDPSKVKEKVFIRLKEKFRLETNIIVDSVIDLKEVDRLWDMPILPHALVEEWVANICYSEIVITDSFHGLCFALIFNKNFIVITEPGNWRGRARFESILSVLGLENRLIESVDEITDELFTIGIDYAKVNKKMNDLKVLSENWLKERLKECSNYVGKLTVYDFLEKESDKLVEEKDELLHKLEEVRNTNDNLSQQLEQVSELKQDLEYQIEQVNFDNQELQKQVEQITNDNKKSQQQIEQMYCDRKSLEEQIEQICYKNTDLQEKLERILMDNRELIENNKRIEDFNQRSLEKIKELTEIKEQYFIKNQQLGKQLSDLYASTSWKVTGGLRWIKRKILKFISYFSYEKQ